MIEYRVVCANHGQRGHSTHAWKKPNMKKATQSVIDLNHHAEINRNGYYIGEAPYRVESRTVTRWDTHLEEHMCPTCGTYETLEAEAQCRTCANAECALCTNQAERGNWCVPCLRHEQSFTH